MHAQQVAIAGGYLGEVLSARLRELQVLSYKIRSPDKVLFFVHYLFPITNPDGRGRSANLEVRKNFFSGRLAGYDRYFRRELFFILLSDSDIHSRQIHEFVVEGNDPFDIDDIPPMDPAEQGLRKNAFPLFEGDQDHDASVIHDETSIVFTGFDVDDIMHIYLHVPAILADKEK
jgi:hypothetical protein